MGLIYQIIKRTKTVRLPSPRVDINKALVISASDKKHFETIKRFASKEKSATPLTKNDTKDFRAASSALKKRGSLKWIYEVEE